MILFLFCKKISLAACLFVQRGPVIKGCCDQGFKTEGGQLLPVVEQGWWFAWALPSLMFSGLIRRFERRWKWAVSTLGLFWSEGMGGRHVIWQLYLQSLRYKSTFGCQRLGCQSEHHSVGRHPTRRQYFCSSSPSLSKYMLTLLLPSNTSKHHWFGRATQKRGKYNNLLGITCRSRCGALCDDAQCSLTLVLRASGAGGRQEWDVIMFAYLGSFLPFFQTGGLQLWMELVLASIVLQS